MPATRAFIPRIALAFDFDRTLATDSVDAVLGVYGIERAAWDCGFDGALGEGWDDIIRRGQALIELGRAKGRPLDLDVLREAAQAVRLYDGVTEMPGRLGRVAREIHEGAQVECIVLSSGYAEIIGATAIERAFDRILASTFYFDGDGRAVCVKRIIGHPENALYLDAIGKGVSVDGSNAPEAATRDVPEAERHVPYDQMIYVGDGASDLQAFGFITGEGGLAIAIDKDEVFDDADAQTPSQRVDDLAPPDYSEGSELLDALSHAVRACASRMALRALGRGSS